MSNGLRMDRKTVRSHIVRLAELGAINVEWRDGRAPLITMNGGGGKEDHLEKDYPEVVQSTTRGGETTTRVGETAPGGGPNDTHDETINDTTNETIEDTTIDSSKTLIPAYGGRHYSAAYSWASKRFPNNGKADSYLLDLHSKGEFPSMERIMGSQKVSPL